MTTQQYLTITALTKYVKRKFDVDPHLQDIYVKGEISNLTAHASGHMYFTLKDESSRIRAVMFSRANRRLKFTPENGMKVLVRGQISVYEQSGQYQMYIQEMQPDGIGDLFLAFEQLKEKLGQEGLFAEEKKRAIPLYPQVIGVITSPTGAAIRDVISTLKRRYPMCKIIVIPALVQGDQAAQSIVKALKSAHDREEKIDTLIVGRGGGSIEDLWPFNEEIVARAIYAAQIPIISAVGHEVDFTIADFVADLRAPTPTAAAELAVPHMADLLEKIRVNESRLTRTMQTKLAANKERFNRITKSYVFRFPRKIYEQKLEKLDRSTEQLLRHTKKVYEMSDMKLERLQERLKRSHPDKLIQGKKEAYERSAEAFQRASKQLLLHKQKDFNLMIAKLEGLNPLKIMDRGYSLVYDQEKNLVKSVEKVQANEKIAIHLVDGQLLCNVLEVEGEKHHVK